MADVRVLLVGNPNAGKSTLFNRLTGGHARVGNWHGVTVDAREGHATLAGKEVAFVDLPGIYTAEGRSMEEKFACRYVAEHGGDFLLFVSEYATVERFLPLMAELTKGKRRAALVLTKRKLFERAGGKLNAAALSARLGIPVLSAEERGLKQSLARALGAPAAAVPSADISDLFHPVREGLSKADRFLLSGWGIAFFFLLLVAAFFLTFAGGMPGDLMKSGVEWLFSEYLGGIAAGISSPVVRSLVQDGILKSLSSVLSFLPQIALLHLFLVLLEESGLLSRLAVLTDGFFSKVGLSGRAVFSLLMGFGCTAAAILTTRGLDDKRMQRRVILCLPYISCSAKLPVYLALSASFFQNPFLAVLLLYALGVGLSVIAALLLRERMPSFVMELAPLQVPRPIFLLKSLLFQIKQFIIKVGTVILAFFLASWLLSSFDFTFALCAVEDSMLARICGALKWMFAPIGMHDWRIAYAALSGLIAKENVAGAIALLYGTFPYAGASAFSFAVFILACSPCVSAISASARELGWKRAALYALGQTVSALLLCYAVYFCLTGGALYVGLAAALLAAIFLVGKNREKIRRRTTKLSQRFHRRDLRAGLDVLPHAAQTEGDPRQRPKGGGELPLGSGRRGVLLHDARAGGEGGVSHRL